MNHLYAINLAKTEFREAFNAGDAERVASVFSNSVTDFSDGFPSFFGAEASTVLRTRFQLLFARCHARVVVTIIDIMLLGETAIEYGWHEFTLTPKGAGRPHTYRERYLEMWAKQADGTWKIVLYISNSDHDPQMPEAEQAVESAAMRQMIGKP